MKPMHARGRSLLVAVLLNINAVQAQVGLTADAKGAKDHPEIPRIDGSLLIDHAYGKFDETEVPLGKALDHKGKFEKSAKFEGERTRLLYVLPDERGSLEVERNYRDVLGKRGYELVFSCQNKACVATNDENDFMRSFYTKSSRELKATSSGSKHVWAAMTSEADRFAVFQRTKPADGGYAMLMIAADTNINKSGGMQFKGTRLAYFELIEAKAMESSMVTVSATDMNRDIGASGKTVLYGILFDFDKIDIKPESKPQLQEMATLLKQNPKLNVYIVGHTDNKGTLDYNQDLSQRRAEAVVHALATEYKVNARQMAPKGLANYAPVASNDSEEGRAKNRRVELVKQ